MNQYSLATIILFTSNEAEFCASCIQEAKKFSSKVIITAWDHFFDGIAEDISSLYKLAQHFPDCDFYLFPYLPNFIPKKMFSRLEEDLWFNLSRYLGYCCVEKTIEYCLFLDGVEIVDSSRFMSWLRSGQHRFYEAMKLASYWYFRLPTLQAKSWEDSALLAKQDSLHRNCFLQKGDRQAIFETIHGNKKHHVIGNDNLPMLHHYRWIGTKEEMKTKLTSHKTGAFSKAFLEKECSFPQEENIHDCELKEVEAFLSFEEKAIQEKKSFESSYKNIYKISSSRFLQMLGYGPFFRFFYRAKSRLTDKMLELNHSRTKS